MRIDKPDLDWKNLVAFASIYLGVLCFLVTLHILALSTGGDTASVLNVTFTVFLYIYYAALVFGFAGLMIQVITYLAWLTTTPEWLKKKQKEESKRLKNARY